MADWTDLLRTGPDPADIGNAFYQGQATAMQLQQQRMKMAADQRQQAATTQYRSQVADVLRNGDYLGASALAAAAGDDNGAKNFIALQTRKDNLASSGANSFGEIVRGVAALPYEQRRGAIQSATPELVAHGFSANDIASFDPTDANIAAVSGLGYSAHERISDSTNQQNADSNTTNAQVNQENADTQRITATNPVVVGENASLVGRDGSVRYSGPSFHTASTSDNVYFTPGQASAPTQSAPSDVWTRMIHQESRGHQFAADGQPLTSPAGAIGIARIMPGTGPQAAALAGVPWDAQRFAHDANYNASLGQAYFSSLVSRYGGDTAKAAAAYNAGPGRVDRAVATGGANWQASLPSETKNYLANVVPSAPQRIQSATPKIIQQGEDKGSADNSPDAVDSLARQYLLTGQLPPLGTGGANLRQAVYQKVAEIQRQNGWTAGDIARNRAVYKAEGANLTQLQKQRGIAASSEETALGNGQNYLDFSSQVKGQTRSPFINGIVNAYHYQTGDPNIQAANSAYQTFVTEYARVVTQSGNGTGTLSDSARHENMAILNSNAAPAQKQSAFNAMKLDMDTRLKAMDRNIAAAQQRIANIGGVASTDPAAQRTPSAGAVAHLKSNPALRGQFDQWYGAGAAAKVLGR